MARPPRSLQLEGYSPAAVLTSPIRSGLARRGLRLGLARPRALLLGLCRQAVTAPQRFCILLSFRGRKRVEPLLPAATELQEAGIPAPPPPSAVAALLPPSSRGASAQRSLFSGAFFAPRNVVADLLESSESPTPFPRLALRLPPPQCPGRPVPRDIACRKFLIASSAVAYPQQPFQAFCRHASVGFVDLTEIWRPGYPCMFPRLLGSDSSESSALIRVISFEPSHHLIAVIFCSLEQKMTRIRVIC